MEACRSVQGWRRSSGRRFIDAAFGAGSRTVGRLRGSTVTLMTASTFDSRLQINLRDQFYLRLAYVLGFKLHQQHL